MHDPGPQTKANHAPAGPVPITVSPSHGLTASAGITRLAPSPTGALHLGNARTFLINWALAQQHAWSIVLRIEDLDGPRVKPGAIDATIDTLRWLGLTWDSGPIVQSHDLDPYRAAMRSLAHRGLGYPCALSRTEIESAASAPQEGAHESPYPASLRPALHPRDFDDENTNWRFAVPDESVTFLDAFAGPQTIRPAQTIGDFIIWTKRAQPSYQLAVVVDDHRQAITQIVRGDDLLDSAARQLLLYRALGLTPEPTYTHLPLVRGPDGRRLAKRHGDTRLETYRAASVPPERIVNLIARWCGTSPVSHSNPAPPQGPPHPLTLSPTHRLSSFARHLDLCSIPREPIVFNEEDHQWLLAGATHP
jgi:glutamyl-tRNA synthetase